MTSSSGLRAWQIPLRAWQQEGAEGRGWSADIEEEDEAFSIREPTRTEAVEELQSYLVTGYLEGKLTAKHVCTISFWAYHAGLSEMKALSLRPDSESGHFNRLLVDVLGLRATHQSLYDLRAPMYSKAELGRTISTIPVYPPHEAISSEVEAHPEIQEGMAAAVASGDFGPRYNRHMIVQSTGFTAIPLAVYFDGVPYTKSDSVLGVWTQNLASGTRHLSAVLKKSKLCRCGCQGHCTLFEVFEFLKWSFTCLARGVHPEFRHEGGPFSESDRRLSRAGQPLACTGAVLMIKGDWMEYCHTLGFATWQSLAAPCPFCRANGDNWMNLRGLSPVMFPHRIVTSEDYESFISAAEVVVVMDESLRRKVLRALRDERSGKGKILQFDIPGTPLLKGDRLEPSPVLRDVHALEELQLPASVTFWRRSACLRANHRFSLICRDLGIGIDTIMIDQLHAFNLGPMREYCKELIWELILADAWGFGEGRTREDLIDLSVMALFAELQGWYSKWKTDSPDEELTEIEDLQPSMLGTSNARTLHFKAAETKGVLLFLVSGIPDRLSKLERADAWPAAGLALVGMLDIFKSPEATLTVSQIQDVRRYCIYI